MKNSVKAAIISASMLAVAAIITCICVFTINRNNTQQYSYKNFDMSAILQKK